MPTKYKEQEIVDMVKPQLSNPLLYQKDFLNYKGNTKDSGKSYGEVISETLLKNYEAFRNIGTGIKIRPEWCDSYNHTGKSFAKGVAFTEKRLAIALFNFNKICFGEIFDYEVPLKGKESKEEDKFGDIDLVALDQENKSVKLIELKIKHSQKDETLLRAILEIYTYYKLISDSKDKFMEDYHEKNDTIKAIELLSLQEDYRFQPVILTAAESESGKMIKMLCKENKPVKLKELILRMNQEIKENKGNEFEFYTYKYPGNKPFKKDNDGKILFNGDDINIQRELF